MFQNLALLIGFLGKDAEFKATRQNGSFTVLSLATNRIWKDRETGDRRSETTWHRCIVWGTSGTFAATLQKGAHLQIEGDIRTRQYQLTSGKNAIETKSITEIHVTRIAKLDRAGADEKPVPEPKEAAA